MSKAKIKQIHVNQFVIRHNKKYNNSLPPYRVQVGSKSRYCREMIIHGPSHPVYRPEAPLSCGAKCWIETEAEVTLIDEIPYSDIRKEMEAIRNA